MSHPPIGRPHSDEHIPYHKTYIDLVPGDNPLTALKHVTEPAIEFWKAIPEERSFHRYAEGKWSVKEVLGHVIDTERIFAYRALRVARADETPLPSFEQDDYVRAAESDSCSWHSLLEEFELVRKANVLMFGSLPSEAWLRTGTVSNNRLSVRALAYILAGHEMHHRKILVERYGIA